MSELLHLLQSLAGSQELTRLLPCTPSATSSVDIGTEGSLPYSSSGI